MKKLKQIFTMIFTMIFVVGACLSAYATGPGSITITNDPKSTGASMVGHTYSVYRVFNLTMSDDATKLSYTVNDDFKGYFIGKSGDSELAGKELNEFAKTYITDTNKNTVAKELMDYATTADSKVEPIKTTDKSHVKVGTDKKETVSITGLALGYYLVVDNGRQGVETPKSAVALAAMGTTDKELDITLKASAPTIDKQIKHNESESWGNVGDNQIGDDVKYRFISTIPNTTGYTKYEYIIHDKMTEGLTFNNDVEIYVGEKTEDSATNKLDVDYYTVTKNPTDDHNPKDGHTFDISIDVINGIKNNKFVAGNELYIYFSATLNEKAVVADKYNDNTNTVYLEYSNNPYDETSKDKTPVVTVKDYTFKLNALKTIEDGKTPLEGAKFEIIEDNKPLYFTVLEDGDNNVYTVCSKKHTHVESSGCITTIDSGKNGRFEIVGLDDATKYTIVETEAPGLYNPIKPIDFIITAEYNTDGSIGSVKTNLDSIKAPNGSFELATTIVNTTDTLLPETGGIGTTIFKILGSAMMILAAVVFIRKRHIG